MRSAIRRGDIAIPAWAPEAALLCAMVVAALVILWLGRGATYSIDELFWFMDSPNLGVSGALQPHVGHLILTSRLVYKLIFETLGTGYFPFRLLALGSVLLTVGLVFAYLRRCVGGAAALAPCLVLLFFGSDTNHLLQGNGFAVLGSVSCGLGALLLLDRHDALGNVGACALLCIGIATYSVALAFLAGCAVLVLIDDDRWRRAWIAFIPAALYLAWWFWARHSPAELRATDRHLQFPVDTRLGCAVAGLRTGCTRRHQLRFPCQSRRVAGGIRSGPGRGNAVGWRLARGNVPATLWAALAVLFTLWILQALAPNVDRLPWSPRYLFPVGHRHPARRCRMRKGE